MDGERATLPLWRRLLARRPIKVLFFAGLTLILFETVARVGTAVKLGPSVMLYGTRYARGMTEHQTWDQAADIQDKEALVLGEGEASYAKYRASRPKTVPLHGGGSAIARINNHGFRGADFTAKKPLGVLRVVALGASSTFGYFDRDEETYPAYLQGYLSGAMGAEALDGISSVEVLNFGIPHLESDQIRALFMAEALAVDPDVVTFYEGVNDTRRLVRSLHERAFNWMASKSLLLRWVQLTLWDRFESFDASDVVEHTAGKADFFVGNIAAIAEQCRQRGIRFIAVSQQATSRSLTREQLRSTSYAAEESFIRERLESTGRLSGLELVFLIHFDLNRGLRAWAEEQGELYVDGVKLFDELNKRDALVSWVHLSPHGNQMLAAAIGAKIIETQADAD